MTNYGYKIVTLLLGIIGLSGSIGFILNQPTWVVRAQSSVIVPIPLVFDAPLGYEFWGNHYEMEFQTEHRIFPRIVADPAFYRSFPHNVMITNSLAVVNAMAPILEPSLWKPMAQYLFCRPGPLSKRLGFNPTDLIKVKLYIKKISDPTTTWEQEVRCF